MTIRGAILLLIAGIVGALIGLVMPSDAPKAHPTPSVGVATGADDTGQDCNAERAELASTKTQLAICMAFDMRVSDSDPSSAAEIGRPTDPPFLSKDDEIRQNRTLLDSYSEAVIFQHADGRTRVYRLDEWPIDSDGIIVARKLPSGDIAWYSGPDAGPRTDPAAFNNVSDFSDFVVPNIERAPDGTIMVNGEPADNAVQRMFGGKIRQEQEEAP